MMRATGKEIAEHVIRPTKVLPSSRIKARCKQLLIIIHRLWKVLKRVEEREERRGRRSSVSNGSGLPSFGPGWNGPECPG